MNAFNKFNVQEANSLILGLYLLIRIPRTNMKKYRQMILVPWIKAILRRSGKVLSGDSRHMLAGIKIF